MVGTSHRSTDASSTTFPYTKRGVVLIVIINIIEFDSIAVQKLSDLIGGD